MTQQNIVRLPVELGRRSYAIHIGSDLLANSSSFAGAITGSRVLVVTNSVVSQWYLQPLVAALAAYDTNTLILEDGEAHKTLATTEKIYTHLLQGCYGRDATIVALGGGVTGDIAGFAAACYQRGIDFVQVPTTLLAQVDSSVGGKTGVNHPLGKNMIGAFHQPTRVIADIDVLATLPEREFSAGLAEVIKYGLINDRAFFDWLEANMPAILAREPATLVEIIRRSCANKAEIVAEDERETGVRALLNLGHTFGHAIETAMGYGEWLHGEAVAAGICMAADLSVRLGWLVEAERQRAVALLAAAKLPTQPPSELNPAQMLDLMGHDKKVLGGTLRLILMRAIGDATLSTDYDDASLQATLDQFLS